MLVATYSLASKPLAPREHSYEQTLEEKGVA